MAMFAVSEEQFAGEGNSQLLCLAPGKYLQGLDVSQPGHLSGDSALRKGETLCYICNGRGRELRYILQNPYLLLLKRSNYIGQADFIEASVDVAEIGRLVDLILLRDAGNSECAPCHPM